MKLISKKQICWNLVCQRRLILRKHKKRIKKKKKIRAARRKIQRGKNNKWWDISIDAPEIFAIRFSPYREETLLFLDKIRKVLSYKDFKVRLNFKETRIITSDAGILLRANLGKLAVEKQINTIVKCAPSKNSKINEVLTQIRVLKLFGQNFQITPHCDDVIHWNLAEGHGADGEKYERILGAYDGTLSPALSTGFYLGLTEAMTNTRQHAYPQPAMLCSDISEWWMFSQEKDGRLSVVFCDLGIGIPESLPKKQPKIWGIILNSMKPNDGDAEIIEATIRLKKSSTELTHRGKGLTQLEDVIKGVKDAKLRIYSNKGCYALEDGTKKLDNYQTSINGTLVYWSIPIQ